MKYVVLILSLAFMMSCSSKRHLNSDDVLGSRALSVWIVSYVDGKGHIPTKEEFLDWNNDGIIYSLQELYDVPLDEAKKIVKDSIVGGKKKLEYVEMVDTTYGTLANMPSKIVASHYLSQHKKIKFVEVGDSILKVIDYGVLNEKGECANFVIDMNRVHGGELIPVDTTPTKNPVVDDMYTEWADETQDIVEVDKKAQYPGGTIALQQYLKNNLNYPKEAIALKKHGTVIVKFVVGEDGAISDVTVIRSVDPLLDQEAVRFVKSMGYWVPATVGDRAVRSSVRLPINFKL
ncbi:MAG: energy transducer TonB [Paludibacteraceae bacterium]|nr:energy transducer TonB [Paludibacteraceae bacterium]